MSTPKHAGSKLPIAAIVIFLLAAGGILIPSGSSDGSIDSLISDGAESVEATFEISTLDDWAFTMGKGKAKGSADDGEGNGKGKSKGNDN